MTEKRFQYNVNKNSIEENGKFVAYVNSVDGVRIANKLNILQKENEQLKQRVEQLESNIEKYVDAKYRKFVDGEVRGWSIGTVNDELQKVKEENEELKQVLGSILIEVKQEISTQKTGKIRAFINPNSFDLISEVLRKYGGLNGWYDD